jgi:hypothetical protein
METKYLTEKDVARITRKAVQSLRNERSEGRGIPFIRFGRKILYNKQDVIQHLEARKVLTEPGWVMVTDERGNRYLCPEGAATQK